MKYIKNSIGPYNIHMIKINKFKTVTVRVNFKRKTVKEELTYRSLLSDILTESSRKYPNQRLLTIAMEDLYNLKLSSNVNLSGNYSIMSFMTRFLNENYTEEGMLEKSISFLMDIILDPDLENDNFKEDKLKNVKNKLTEVIKENEKNPIYYATYKMLETMNDKAIYALNANGYIDDIDEINVENLTEYYKQVIHSDIVDIFIVGDIDNNLIKRIITEKLNINTIKKQGESHFVNHDKFRKRAKKVSEKYDSKQSNLVIGSKIEPLTEFERKYVSFVYNFILGGGPDSRLFKTVREKNSLCYNISSRLRLLTNLLIINVGVDKKNIEKTTRLIRKEMLNISKGLFEEDEIEKAKVNYKNALDEIIDFPAGIINHYIEKEYYGNDTYEDRIIQINKINKQMIVDFAKKVHVDTVFVLEGGE